MNAVLVKKTFVLTFNISYFRDAKNMAVDVRNLVLRAIIEKGGKTETDAIQYLKKLESMKKYSADVWS